MQEIYVKNVIIGKQYEKFKDIVEDKKINVITVEAGQKVDIEKNLYFEILWPSRRK